MIFLLFYKFSYIFQPIFEVIFHLFQLMSLTQRVLFLIFSKMTAQVFVAYIYFLAGSIDSFIQLHGSERS